jgi:hypothetical protein
MLPFDRAYLEQLSEDDLTKLANLDSLGFLVGPKETFEDFRQRLLKLCDALKEFEDKLEQGEDEIEIFDGITVRKDKSIPTEVIEEAGKVTEHYYRFSINWAPGFFMSKDIGWLWGGCALSDNEQVLTIFLIRSNFMNKRKWFIYDRRELLAHELCHTARHVINDNKLEEFFAYQTAPSIIRRYMGNCFIYKYDAILFLLPTMILLAAQMLRTFTTYDFPIWPFWIIAFSYPVFLLVRNNIARVVFFRACSKLLAFGFIDASAILFRCDWHTVVEISLLASPEAFRRFVQKKSSSELNWKIIQHRFVIHNGENEITESEEVNDAT